MLLVMPIIYTLLIVVHLTVTVWLYNMDMMTSTINYLYPLTTGLITLLSSIQAAIYFKKLPNFRKIIIGTLIAALTFTIGEIFVTYNNLSGTPLVPYYPQIGDIFFLTFYPAYFYFLIQISKLGELKWNSLAILAWLVLSITLVGIIIIFLSTFLDFANNLNTSLLYLLYPSLDAILLSLSIIIFHSHVGMKYTYLLLFLFGFVAIGISDTFFAYQNVTNTYWIGNIVDFLYVLSHGLLALGVNFFYKLSSSSAIQPQPQKVQINN